MHLSSEKVNGNMDSAKYQSGIIHYTELLCERIVFPQQGYIFIHDIAPCHNSKVLEHSKNVKEYPFQND